MTWMPRAQSIAVKYEVRKPKTVFKVSSPDTTPLALNNFDSLC